jgi:hypothetical protein
MPRRWGFERAHEISCYSTTGLLARVIPAGPGNRGGNPNSIAGYKDGGDDERPEPLC